MDIVIRAAVVYLFVWMVLRALGRRQLGEITVFELVLLFVIGDLVQQSITQNDTSVTAAVLAISTISLLIFAQSYVAFRWRRFRPAIEGGPIVLVHDGHVLDQVMRTQRMTYDEVLEAAREQGIDDLLDVRVGIIENDGNLSFITYSERDPRRGPGERRS